MIFNEVNWIRKNKHKLCPDLRKQSLNLYKSIRFVPCFLQKFFRNIKRNFKKIPVIIQTDTININNKNSIKFLANSFGCHLKKDLSIINAFSTKATAKTLEVLVKDSRVRHIWLDREVNTVLDIASPTVKSPVLWDQKYTGKNIVVAILDTGIYNHPDLSNRIIAFKDLIKNKTSPYDDNGHGTHVAGDVASNGYQSNYSYKAPANEAKVIGIKVLNKMGSGSLSTVIEGVQWCINNKENYNIKVLNLSLGSKATQPYQIDPLCQAIERAWDSSITVCVAAGNNGPDAGTVTSPGIHPKVITVGALNDYDTISTNDDKVADFSGRGPTIDNLIKPDLLAPGVNIISLRSPNSQLDKQHRDLRIDSWYTSLSGTSMATPICAGIVAQIIQSSPSLKPNEVKSMLMSTADKIPNLDTNIQGSGIINAEKAWRSL